MVVEVVVVVVIMPMIVIVMSTVGMGRGVVLNAQDNR